MAEKAPKRERTARSIELDKRIWEALDSEAEQQMRSGVKQLEYLLTYYYFGKKSEVNFERLDEMRETELKKAG